MYKDWFSYSYLKIIEYVGFTYVTFIIIHLKVRHDSTIIFGQGDEILTISTKFTYSMGNPQFHRNIDDFIEKSNEIMIRQMFNYKTCL